jgi:hypothetical protein
MDITNSHFQHHLPLVAHHEPCSMLQVKLRYTVGASKALVSMVKIGVNSCSIHVHCFCQKYKKKSVDFCPENEKWWFNTNNSEINRAACP